MANSYSATKKITITKQKQPRELGNSAVEKSKKIRIKSLKKQRNKIYIYVYYNTFQSGCVFRLRRRETNNVVGYRATDVKRRIAFYYYYYIVTYHLSQYWYTQKTSSVISYDTFSPPTVKASGWPPLDRL